PCLDCAPRWFSQSASPAEGDLVAKPTITARLRPGARTPEAQAARPRAQRPAAEQERVAVRPAGALQAQLQRALAREQVVQPLEEAAALAREGEPPAAMAVLTVVAFFMWPTTVPSRTSVEPFLRFQSTRKPVSSQR